MNKNAEQNLAKAKDYIAKGDEFYRKAKIEISVAIEQDPVLSQQDIATAVGMSKTWVADVIKWDGKGTLYGKDTGRRQIDMAKQVLREASPEQTDDLVASLPHQAVAKVAKSVSREYGRRGEEAKQKSEKAFREEVGDSFADELAEEQRLRDAESKVFEARRALRDMLALLNEADLDAMRDSWREDFLKTLDDVAMRIDLARSLLSGTLTEDLERFLAEV